MNNKILANLDMIKFNADNLRDWYKNQNDSNKVYFLSRIIGDVEALKESIEHDEKTQINKI